MACICKNVYNKYTMYGKVHIDNTYRFMEMYIMLAFFGVNISIPLVEKLIILP